MDFYNSNNFRTIRNSRFYANGIPFAEGIPSEGKFCALLTYFSLIFTV